MKTIKLLVSIFGAMLVLTNFVAAHTGTDNYSHHDMMGSFGIGSFVFMWLFLVLIIIALILFIVWLIKQIQNPKKRRRK